MPVNPVDMQIIVPKTTEMSKVSSEEQNKNQAMQQQQSMINKNKFEENLKQVYSKKDAQDVKISKEGKNAQEEEQKKKKKKKDKKDSKKRADKELRTSTIDVQI